MVHPSNLLFVADFDNTCSVQDTSDVLISLGGSEACYEELITTLCQNIENCLAAPSTSSKDLRSLLKELEDFEKTTNQQVMQRSLLKGISRERIRAAANTIPLHIGCGEFMQRIATLGSQVHIISANWSRDLIEAALPRVAHGLLSIHSNDLSYDQHGVCNGNFELKIQDSFDKEDILHSCSCQTNRMVVFIGDSMNDLLAMLDADLGIIMATDMVMHEDLGVIMDTNETLKTLLSLFSIEVIPLEAAYSQIQASGAPISFRHTGKLFQVTSWAQVEACLLGARD